MAVGLSGESTAGAEVRLAGDQAIVHARRFLALLALLVVCGLALSLHLLRLEAQKEYRELARIAAGSFFRGVMVTRRWNALHGGVYVPVTESTQPNPYLDDPQRDLTTTDGLRLTKINPAYMTRMISEVLNAEDAVRFHITSLKPIRPANAPDPWEREALRAFEGGATQRDEVLGSGDEASYRYMAPLRTEAPCLDCHAAQGYRLGEVRGGISVTFPFGPYLAALRRHERNLLSAHLLVLAGGLAVVLTLGRTLLSRVRELQAAAGRITTLEGLLPICARCKRIRREGGDPHQQQSWQHVESYLGARTAVEFSHGLCPECARTLYGDFYKPPPDRGAAG